MSDVIELVEVETLKAADICPDYDDECADVTDVNACFCGNWGIGAAQGYCPMLFKSTTQADKG